MSEPLTPNAQAILLLTAPLIAGPGATSRELLTLGDYNRLARILREKRKQPADLLASDGSEVVALCAEHFGRTRIEGLLGRGFLLSQAVERWSARAIWVVSRADPHYPRRLKARLREDSPSVLYGCGSISLLEQGGLAVVGSRHIDEELIAYTENVGRVSSEAHRMIISGGAKGIDRAAMNGALQAGGAVAGVMADSLERAALARENREPLMDGRLVLISPYDPSAGFNVGHAMQRNKLIYALADAALVVTSDLEKGGTWTGAIEQLERLHFVPVFAHNSAKAGKGNAALLSRGALRWPEPQNGQELEAAIDTANVAKAAEPKQDTLPLTLREEAVPYDATAAEETLPVPIDTAAKISRAPHARARDELLAAVRTIVPRALAEPRTADEIAETLAIAKPQAKAWLSQLVIEGLVEKVKKSKPPRFRAVQDSDRLL